MRGCCEDVVKKRGILPRKKDIAVVTLGVGNWRNGYWSFLVVRSASEELLWKEMLLEDCIGTLE